MKKNIIGIVILTTIISGCGSLSTLKSKGIDAVQREAGNQIKEKNGQESETVREMQEGFTIYCDDAKEYSYSYRIYGISGEILEEKNLSL